MRNWEKKNGKISKNCKIEKMENSQVSCKIRQMKKVEMQNFIIIKLNEVLQEYMLARLRYTRISIFLKNPTCEIFQVMIDNCRLPIFGEKAW